MGDGVRLLSLAPPPEAYFLHQDSISLRSDNLSKCYHQLGACIQTREPMGTFYVCATVKPEPPVPSEFFQGP